MAHTFPRKPKIFGTKIILIQQNSFTLATLTTFQFTPKYHCYATNVCVFPGFRYSDYPSNNYGIRGFV